eukprot:c27666_g1_i3 orf=1-339(-)
MYNGCPHTSGGQICIKSIIRHTSQQLINDLLLQTQGNSQAVILQFHTKNHRFNIQRLEDCHGTFIHSICFTLPSQYHKITLLHIHKANHKFCTTREGKITNKFSFNIYHDEFW